MSSASTEDTSNGHVADTTHAAGENEEVPLLHGSGSGAAAGAQKRLTMWGLVFLTYFAGMSLLSG